MNKKYWWCKTNKNLSDLDLALTYLSLKTNFKFYYNESRWVYVSNIRRFTYYEKNVYIDADLKYLNSLKMEPTVLWKYGNFSTATIKQVTKL